MLLTALTGVGFAQQAALSLSSGSVQDGGSVGLSLSLTNSASAQAGALEWTMTYPATEFSGVSIAAGAAASAAGTAPSCSGGAGTVVCVLDGMQDTAIGNGVVATITLGVPATAPSGTAAIAITSPVAVGVNGSSIPAASVGANVSIQAIQPTLTGVSCSPTSVTSPGSATCTVTLSAAAPTGGSVISLSSNNTSVSVPATATAAAGSTTAAFTATVASVSSAVTATLTATLGTSSQTFALGATPPPTWSISGTITPATSGVTVTLSGAASQTATSNSSGAYTFSGLANGSYAVTPALAGYTFTPASQTVTLSGANQSVVNFTLQPTITGVSCSPASVTSPGSAACTVTLSAAAPTGGSVVTLSSNNTNVTVPASITVAAASTTGAFTATVASVSSAVTATLTATLGTSSQTFALAVTPPATWSVSGTITPAISGVTVSLSGAAGKTATSNSSGAYTFSGLANGSYTVTPTLAGYTFTPAAQAVTLNGANQSAVNFTDAAQPALTGISCSPASVTSPGSASCTVTLSVAAPTGGSVVTLSSNSTSVTVPASVTVAAGSTTAAFTATVASVSSAVTATLTATLGSSSQTFALGVTSPATWSISGTITPATSGVTVTLSGAASQTATSNSSGAYTLSGLQDGSYTLTPALAGYTFTPASQSVTVNGANQSAVTFTAAQTQKYVAPTVDVETSTNQRSPSSEVESGNFSTRSTDELLLAFVSANTSGATVSGVSGAGLTWSLVVRTSVQSGTAEIWRSFASQKLNRVAVTASLNQKSASSLTVISFAGADPSGVNGSGAIGAVATANAASGTPSASFVTTRNDSLVRGVGEDPKAAIVPLPVAGQGLVQEFTVTGAAYWVQSVTKPVAQGGTTVTLGDSSPATDPYNLSAVEILAAPPSTSGAAEITMARAPVVASSPNGAVTSAGESSLVMYHPASGATGDVCSPGGLVSLSGSGFTSQSPQQVQSAVLPDRLGGVQVKVNGEAAGLSFISASRVNFQCPQFAPGSALDVTVESENGSIQRPPASSMAAAVPGIFPADATNQAVVKQQTIATPAKQGDTLAIYASGLGSASGAPYPVKIAIGNAYADPLSVSPVTSAAGLFQIEFAVPAGTSSGPTVPLHLEVTLPDQTTVWSNTVTLAIQ